MEIEVLYEDNHLFAAKKPAGIPTQGENGAGFQEACRQYLKEKLNKPGNVYLHAAHRIDTPVSGIVLFAKSSKALSRLQESMRQHKIEKYYHAIVEGMLEEENGTLKHNLIHDEKNYRAVVSKDGKPAVLSYRVLKTENGNTHVEIKLETGRYHQIRAQFSAIGHPVLGDAKYGSRKMFVAGEIALMHCRMVVPHPTLGKNVAIECKI